MAPSPSEIKSGLMEEAKTIAALKDKTEKNVEKIYHLVTKAKNTAQNILHEVGQIPTPQIKLVGFILDASPTSDCYFHPVFYLDPDQTVSGHPKVRYWVATSNDLHPMSITKNSITARIQWTGDSTLNQAVVITPKDEKICLPIQTKRSITAVIFEPERDRTHLVITAMFELEGQPSNKKLSDLQRHRQQAVVSQSVLDMLKNALDPTPPDSDT
ncbi:hypothetical protein A2397_03945 [Candidatus Amesbacteria bacterium RIFOXYB1_FULL_44_23]|uniref:Uncharacterized protein n=1 Tax=Candidatus Amesbacteria bacterium RIFOXYB1_FULL_44_23 TaxID=1797263 RepID=A0A1F4ZSX6_9BACT|nr:MAG: hypothetical protein A2397_03945 [Candidatus Amesbacteria bacterium RIFOXYB1_FULL_44_23]